MKNILLSSVALIGLAGTAVAADLPARMPVKAPPIMAPAFNWSGCYIGGYVGGAWHRGDDTKTDLGIPGIADGVTLAAYNNLFDHSWGYKLDSSIIGGGTLGCNWQPVGSALVLGIEAEGGYMHLSGSGTDPISWNVAGTRGGDTVATTTIGDWYAMITGRLGVAWDRSLLYVKGGAAFVRSEWSVVDTCVAAACGPWTINTGLATNEDVTWTIGGGIEWAFDMNWSVKAEYMYIALDRSVTACAQAFTTAGALVDPRGFCFQNDLNGIHTAKIGLNYRFGGAQVARY